MVSGEWDLKEYQSPSVTLLALREKKETTIQRPAKNEAREGKWIENMYSDPLHSFP